MLVNTGEIIILCHLIFTEALQNGHSEGGQPVQTPIKHALHQPFYNTNISTNPEVNGTDIVNARTHQGRRKCPLVMAGSSHSADQANAGLLNAITTTKLITAAACLLLVATLATVVPIFIWKSLSEYGMLQARRIPNRKSQEPPPYHLVARMDTSLLDRAGNSLIYTSPFVQGSTRKV